MEVLFKKYGIITGSNEFKIFKEFIENKELNDIKEWINNQLNQISANKNTEEAIKFRVKGNGSFKKKDYKSCLIFYTKSLSYAIPNSAEYGLALANRSAVAFELNQFLNCLGDITLCFKTDYPKNLYYKLYVRQAKCYYHLNMNEDFECVMNLIKNLNNPSLLDKVQNLHSIENPENYCKYDFNIPEIQYNENFLYASNKVQLAFNEVKGRHVLAKDDIQIGDILFVEKAFSFAPIYENKTTLVENACHFCLKMQSYLIPCTKCTFCLYCDETCSVSSWNSGHKYECPGMPLWYELGIGYPALKCIFKGIKSEFIEYDYDLKDYVEKFGDADDNYPFFNSLLSHIDKKQNLTEFVVMAAIIVIYLRNFTNFFEDIKNFCKNRGEIKYFIGGLLIRHGEQLACNSSIVSNWEAKFLPNEIFLSTVIPTPKNLFKLTDTCPVACGIYPTISMMNHSCKPNISIYYVQDTAISKATGTIKKGEEILNCYGIDARHYTKQYRQENLFNQYHFKCTCQICNNPELEHDYLYNNYLCETCKIPTNKIDGSMYKCPKCHEKRSAAKYSEIINKCFEELRVNGAPPQEVGRVMEQTYNKFHNDLYEFYRTVYRSSVEIAAENKSINVENDIQLYGGKLREILAETAGEFSRKYGLFLDEFLTGEAQNENEKTILQLYYPINEVNIKKAI